MSERYSGNRDGNQALVGRWRVWLQLGHQHGIGRLDQNRAIGEYDGGHAAQTIIQRLYQFGGVLVFFDVDLNIGHGKIGEDTLGPAAIAAPGCRVHHNGIG